MTSFNRHSGAGRNPVQKYDSRNAGQDQGFVRSAELLFLLDSGLRRNDGILSFMENKK